MTAILNASVLIQLAAMVALVGLASAPILVLWIIRVSPARQRVIAGRRQARTEADIAAPSAIADWSRRN
jgi:hypothetical protein